MELVDGDKIDISARVKDEFTCAICFDMMLAPVTLKCGHNYCQMCIKEFCIRNNVDRQKCPSCAAPIGVDAPQVNLSIDSFLRHMVIGYDDAVKNRVLVFKRLMYFEKYDHSVRHRQNYSKIHDFIATQKWTTYDKIIEHFIGFASEEIIYLLHKMYFSPISFYIHKETIIYSKFLYEYLNAHPEINSRTTLLNIITSVGVPFDNNQNYRAMIRSRCHITNNVTLQKLIQLDDSDEFNFVRFLDTLPEFDSDFESEFDLDATSSDIWES